MISLIRRVCSPAYKAGVFPLHHEPFKPLEGFAPSTSAFEARHASLAPQGP